MSKSVRNHDRISIEQRRQSRREFRTAFKPNYARIKRKLFAPTPDVNVTPDQKNPA